MLREYQKKRNFSLSPEPSATQSPSRSRKKILSFVVQKHYASHLHYDFRLEIAGRLKSWAVPKGPSLNPRNKRLAVQTEDHPLAYKDFHGTIPAGQYGAGKVEIWDCGEFKPQSDPHLQWKKGKIEFELKGKKLQGRWVLLQFKKDPQNWLWFKKSDHYAQESEEITVTKPDPVVKN